MKKKWLVTILGIILIGILFWLTPKRAADAVLLPPEIRMVDHTVTEDSQPPSDLTELNEYLLPNPLIWVPDPNHDQNISKYKSLIDAYVEKISQGKPICAPYWEDQRKTFTALGALNGRIDEEYYLQSYGNQMKLFHLLLSTANSLLQNNDPAGMSYLEAAASLPCRFYRNPPNIELRVGNHMYTMLAQYILIQMPTQWFDADMLCWFPEEKLVRKSLKSALSDIYRRIYVTLGDREGALSATFSKEIYLTPAYWLSNTIWEPPLNESSLLACYDFGLALIDNPLTPHVERPEFRLGFFDFWRLDYLVETMSVEGLDLFRLHIYTSGKVKALGDRVTVRHSLAKEGLEITKEQVERLVDAHGLLNMFTGEPYVVDENGAFILFPEPYEAPRWVDRYSTSFPGIKEL